MTKEMGWGKLMSLTFYSPSSQIKSCMDEMCKATVATHLALREPKLIKSSLDYYENILFRS